MVNYPKKLSFFSSFLVLFRFVNYCSHLFHVVCVMLSLYMYIFSQHQLIIVYFTFCFLHSVWILYRVSKKKKNEKKIYLNIFQNHSFLQK